MADTPFDLSAVPKISRQDEQERGTQEMGGALPSLGGRSNSPPHSGSASNGAGSRPAVSSTPSLDQQALYAQKLAEVPEFASFGPLFKSTAKPVELTELETEYVVSCIKHVFSHHVVFQVQHLQYLYILFPRFVHLVSASTDILLFPFPFSSLTLRTL